MKPLISALSSALAAKQILEPNKNLGEVSKEQSAKMAVGEYIKHHLAKSTTNQEELANAASFLKLSGIKMKITQKNIVGFVVTANQTKIKLSLDVFTENPRIWYNLTDVNLQGCALVKGLSIQIQSYLYR